MGTIYEIVGDVRALRSLIDSMTDEETGEVRELSDEDRKAFGEWIQEQSEAFDEKFDRTCKVYKNLRGIAEVATAERDALKSEMDRLSKRSKARESEADRVKTLILYALDAIGSKKHKTAIFSATIQNTAARVEIVTPPLEMDALLDRLPREMVKREVSKSAIVEAIKSGKWTARSEEGGAVYDDKGERVAGIFYIPGQTCVIR